MHSEKQNKVDNDNVFMHNQCLTLSRTARVFCITLTAAITHIPGTARVQKFKELEAEVKGFAYSADADADGGHEYTKSQVK